MKRRKHAPVVASPGLVLRVRSSAQEGPAEVSWHGPLHHLQVFCEDLLFHWGGGALQERGLLLAAFVVPLEGLDEEPGTVPANSAVFDGRILQLGHA